MTATRTRPEHRRSTTADLTAAFAVAGVELRRLSRDKVGLFFLLVLPFVLILALGTAFPADGGKVRVGVVAGETTGVGGAILAAAGGADTLAITTYTDEREVVRDIQLGELDAGIIIPPGLTAAVEAGDTGEITVDLDPANEASAMVRNMVGAVVQDQALVITASRFAEGRSGVEGAEALAAAEQQVAELARGRVSSVTVVGGSEAAISGFAFVATAQMILFMFINALAGGGSLVEMRTLGVATRSLASPIRVGDVIGGITLARFAVALGQGALIALVSAVVFDVDWGDVAVLAAVLVAFALVSAGGGVLMGALANTPDQAAAIGVPLALAMAGLGGCFFPLAVAPPTMQFVAKVLTPHAWATDALLGAIYDGYDVSAVALNLAVLFGFAALFLSVGTVMLRRRLQRP